MAVHDLATGDLVNTLPSSLQIRVSTSDGLISTFLVPLGAISGFAGESRFSFPFESSVSTVAVGALTYTMTRQGDNSIILNQDAQNTQDFRDLPMFDSGFRGAEAFYLDNEGKLYVASDSGGTGTTVFQVVQTRNVFYFDEVDFPV